MAEIINLRQIRKRKARAESERRAAENRARFGRPATEKRHEAREAERARQALDNQKIERDDPSS